MAGTTLTSLAGKLFSQQALVAATKAVFPISTIAHRYAEAETAPGSQIVVPLFDVPAAKDFDPDDADYTSGTGTVSGVPINLDIHLFQGFNFTDYDFAQCPVAFWKGAGEAIGRALGLGIAAKVVGLINKTNVKKSATNEVVLASLAEKKSSLANLLNTAEAAGFDPAKSTLMLGGKLFSEAIALMDANVYGGPEAVRQGSLAPGCYGFGHIVRCNAFSAATGENLTGAIVAEGALGYCSAPLEPQGKAGLDEYGFATDPDSGLTIGFRRFSTQANGKNHFVGEVLMGAKLTQPTKVVRLVSAATA